MAWIEKRKRYRLRDIIDGERVTLERDLGIWKEAAEAAKVEFRKAISAGFVPDPYSQSNMANARAYLRAKEENRDPSTGGQPILWEDLSAFYLKTHGPSLKGGVSDHWRSAYRHRKDLLGTIDRAWTGKEAHEITYLMVRDFLAQFESVGTRMKYLNTISSVFKQAAIWNEEKIFKPRVMLPATNPASTWRSMLKPAEKREDPDTRVLSPEEWDKFKQFLTPRAYAICDLALRRFLRLSDIRHLKEFQSHDGKLRGRQQKTGDRFAVPGIGTHQGYDFTNFRREFEAAQVAAGMNYPSEHPLHFSPRTLRRTGATWAYRKTKDLDGIRKMLGHRKLTTTQRYLSIDEADLQAIAHAVDELAGVVPARAMAQLKKARLN